MSVCFFLSAGKVIVCNFLKPAINVLFHFLKFALEADTTKSMSRVNVPLWLLVMHFMWLVHLEFFLWEKKRYQLGKQAHWFESEQTNCRFEKAKVRISQPLPHWFWPLFYKCLCCATLCKCNVKQQEFSFLRYHFPMLYQNNKQMPWEKKLPLCLICETSFACKEDYRRLNSNWGVMVYGL